MLALVAVAGWIATPPLLRHLAHRQPLFHRTVDVAAPSSIGDGLHSIATPSGPWRPVHTSVLEDGTPLERTNRARQVEARRGRFHVGAEHIVFSTSDGTDARANGRRYELRRPRDLPASTGPILATAFVLLHLVLLALLALGLFRHRVLRSLVWIPLSAAAVAALLLWLDGRIPASTADLLGEKLEQYAAVREQIDTVFLGSSRVYRHLDPATFESVFAEHGERATAFNLGVPEVRTLEALYLAERLLSEADGHIERLIVEPEDEPLSFREENRLTSRTIRWHDLRAFRRMLPEIRRSSDNTADALLDIVDRLELVAYRDSLVGRGVDVVERWFDDSSRFIDPERRGFLSLDDDRRAPRTPADRDDLETRFRDLHGDPADWQRRLARLRRSSPAGELTDPYELELLGALQELADDHGVELVFVLSPRPVRRPNLVYAAETGVIDRLVRFDDPDAYPDFYRLDGRYDRHHLNHHQALVMTRRLALELLGETGRAAPADAAKRAEQAR